MQPAHSLPRRELGVKHWRFIVSIAMSMPVLPNSALQWMRGAGDTLGDSEELAYHQARESWTGAVVGGKSASNRHCAARSALEAL